MGSVGHRLCFPGAEQRPRSNRAVVLVLLLLSGLDEYGASRAPPTARACAFRLPAPGSAAVLRLRGAGRSMGGYSKGGYSTLPRRHWDEAKARAEWKKMLGSGKRGKNQRRWWKLPFIPHAPKLKPCLHAVDLTGATDPVARRRGADKLGALLMLTSSRGRQMLEDVALVLEQAQGGRGAKGGGGKDLGPRLARQLRKLNLCAAVARAPGPSLGGRHASSVLEVRDASVPSGSKGVGGDGEAMAMVKDAHERSLPLLASLERRHEGAGEGDGAGGEASLARPREGGKREQHDMDMADDASRLRLSHAISVLRNASALREVEHELLWRCALLGDAIGLRNLVKKQGVDINAPDPACYHATALHLASGRGHLSTVTRLLRYGADPNVATVDGQTALHWAASMGHADIVRHLMRAGADAGAETVIGSVTALQIAIANGHSLLADEMRDMLGLRHRALR